MAAARTRSMARSCRRASRTIPPRPMSPRSSSNCGFTRMRNSAPGAAAAASRGNTLATEMKETSTVTSDGCSASAFGFEKARVDLDRDHARILPQFPCQLAGRHVHGVDPSRAVLQQAIGEAARRATRVQANPALGIDAEILERTLELQSSTARRNGVRRRSVRLRRRCGIIVPGLSAR